MPLITSPTKSPNPSKSHDIFSNQVRLAVCNMSNFNRGDYSNHKFIMWIHIGLGYPNLFCIPTKHQMRIKSPIGGLQHDGNAQSLRATQCLMINHNSNGYLKRCQRQSNYGGQNQQPNLSLQSFLLFIKSTESKNGFQSNLHL